MQRIEMTFVGIGTLLILLQIASPNNARSLLDKEVAESLKCLKSMFEDIFSRYKEMVRASCANEKQARARTEESQETELEESKSELDDHDDDSVLDSLEAVELINLESELREMKESPNELNKKFRTSKRIVTA